MAKSIKDKNLYWDSTGISHNRKKLSEYLAEIDNMKTKLLNGWYNFAVAEGSGLRIIIPIFNPTGNLPEVQITSCKIFTSSTWYEIPISNITTTDPTTTSLTFYINASSVVATSANNNYLVQLQGTIKCA